MPFHVPAISDWVDEARMTCSAAGAHQIELQAGAFETRLVTIGIGA